jgi:hypothetical protein
MVWVWKSQWKGLDWERSDYLSVLRDVWSGAHERPVLKALNALQWEPTAARGSAWLTHYCRQKTQVSYMGTYINTLLDSGFNHAHAHTHAHLLNYTHDYYSNALPLNEYNLPGVWKHLNERQQLKVVSTCLPFLYWLNQLPGFSLFQAASFTCSQE